MEPTLVVIGISLRSAKLGLRERFLLASHQISEALTALVRSEAIDEVIVVSNCYRTEFLVWTQDATEAANSVLRYLTRSMNLTLAEWSNYYRLVGDTAVAHVLRVVAGVDGVVFGESEGTNALLGAWQTAQRASTTGRFLDAVMAKAFSVGQQVHQLAVAAPVPPTVAQAALTICQQALGDLPKRRILILGAGQLALQTLRDLQSVGADDITIVNRSWDHAQALARQYKVKAAHLESLFEQVARAEVVISAASGRILLTREQVQELLHERKHKYLHVLDLSVPRTIESSIRTLEGIRAYDLDDLCATMDCCEPRRSLLPIAERIIAEEAAGFRSKLLSESVSCLISAMRERLELICEQEVHQLREQFGPFTEDQELALRTLSAHISQRIAAGVARHMKEPPGSNELTHAVQQLLQLESSHTESELALQVKAAGD